MCFNKLLCPIYKLYIENQEKKRIFNNEELNQTVLAYFFFIIWFWASSDIYDSNMTTIKVGRSLSWHSVS